MSYVSRVSRKVSKIIKGRREKPVLKQTVYEQSTYSVKAVIFKPFFL